MSRVKPAAGSTPSWMAKIDTSSRARKKFGTAMPSTAVVEAIRSTAGAHAGEDPERDADDDGDQEAARHDDTVTGSR